MSVEDLSDELYKTASTLQPNEIIDKLIELFHTANILISKSDIEHLINDSDWDDAAQTFHELILQDMKPHLNFQVCYKIDRILSYINPKVKPGSFWWRAYGFPPTKNLKVGHGLFTFDNQMSD